MVHARRTEPVDQLFQFERERGKVQAEDKIGGLIQRVPDIVRRRGRPLQLGAVLESGDEAPRRRCGVAGKEQIVRQAQSFPLTLGKRLGLDGGEGFGLLLEKVQQQFADALVRAAQVDVKPGIRAQQPSGSPRRGDGDAASQHFRQIAHGQAEIFQRGKQLLTQRAVQGVFAGQRFFDAQQRQQRSAADKKRFFLNGGEHVSRMSVGAAFGGFERPRPACVAPQPGAQRTLGVADAHFERKRSLKEPAGQVSPSEQERQLRRRHEKGKSYGRRRVLRLQRLGIRHGGHRFEQGGIVRSADDEALLAARQQGDINGRLFGTGDRQRLERGSRRRRVQLKRNGFVPERQLELLVQLDGEDSRADAPRADVVAPPTFGAAGVQDQFAEIGVFVQLHGGDRRFAENLFQRPRAVVEKRFHVLAAHGEPAFFLEKWRNQLRGGHRPGGNGPQRGGKKQRRRSVRFEKHGLTPFMADGQHGWDGLNIMKMFSEIKRLLKTPRRAFLTSLCRCGKMSR